MRFAVNWHEAIVRRVADLTSTVRSFEIVPASNSVLPFPVGAHLDVVVQVEGQPQTRSYSLIGEGAVDHYRIMPSIQRRAVRLEWG